MTSVTVSLPEETYRRLDEIARLRGTSIDRLFDEMAALMIAESDAEAGAFVPGLGGDTGKPRRGSGY